MQNKIKKGLRSYADEKKKNEVTQKMKKGKTKEEHNANIDSKYGVLSKKPGHSLLRKGYLHIFQ